MTGNGSVGNFLENDSSPTRYSSQRTCILWVNVAQLLLAYACVVIERWEKAVHTNCL